MTHDWNTELDDWAEEEASILAKKQKRKRKQKKKAAAAAKRSRSVISLGANSAGQSQQSATSGYANLQAGGEKEAEYDIPRQNSEKSPAPEVPKRRRRKKAPPVPKSKTRPPRRSVSDECLQQKSPKNSKKLQSGNHTNQPSLPFNSEALKTGKLGLKSPPKISKSQEFDVNTATVNRRLEDMRRFMSSSDDHFDEGDDEWD